MLLTYAAYSCCLLMLVLIVLLLWTLQHQLTWLGGCLSVHTQDEFEARQYLLPLLANGPNNQLLQLMEVLALSHLLNRTVLLTPIFEHYKDADAEKVTTHGGSKPVYYEYEQLFDL